MLPFFDVITFVKSVFACQFFASKEKNKSQCLVVVFNAILVLFFTFVFTFIFAFVFTSIFVAFQTILDAAFIFDTILVSAQTA